MAVTWINIYDASDPGSTGSTLVDTESGQNMTLQGGAVFNTDFGRYAMRCTNIGDFARLATTTAGQRPSLPVSIAGTFYVDTLPVSFKLFTTDDWRQSQVYEGCAVQVTAAGAVFASFGDGGAGGSNDRRSGQSPASTIVTGQWYTVLCVIRGIADFTIYVDGVSQSISPSGTGDVLAYGTGPMDAGGGETAGGAVSNQLRGAIQKLWYGSGEATPGDLTTTSIYKNRYYIVQNDYIRIYP